MQRQPSRDPWVAFANSRLDPTALCAVVCLVCLTCLAGCRDADSLERVRALQQNNEYAETIEPLRDLLRDHPKDPEINYLYGRALVAIQSPELALYSLRQAMEDPDWFERAAFQLAFAALGTNDFNEVVGAMDQVLESDPDNIDALLVRAQANAHWKKDVASALEDAQIVLDTDPERIEAYEPLILALLALDRIEEANEALAIAGRRLEETGASEEVRAWHCSTTAIFASNTSRLETQAELWNECLERYPSGPVVVDSAIRFFESMGRFDRSLEISRAAYEAEPESRIYRGSLASRLLLAGRVDEGAKMLIEAAKSAEGGAAASAWDDLGEFYHSAGQYTKAARAFGQAVAHTNPADPQQSFRYADALILAGDLPGAEAQLAKLSVEAHRRLIRARVAQERGQNEQALAEFTEAARLWPDNPWARYYAGLSAEALGRWDRALEEYRYSVRINVGATDARTRAAHLLTAHGHLLQAYHILFIKVDENPLDSDGLILGAYLIARVSNASQLQESLQAHLARDPATYPRALIRAAEGLAENGLPEAARNLLDHAPGIEFTDGRYANVLRAFIRFAYQTGDPDAAREALDSALASAPNAAGYHTARALQLELSEASTEDVRAAYLQATELDPYEAAALEGLGHISSGKAEHSKALEWFDKARSVKPDRLEAALGAVKALIALKRDSESARRLDEIVNAHPFSAEATAMRVDLDIDRNSITSETLALAERGLRLGRSAEDYERLSEVLSQLGYAERAREAASAARQLRETEESRRAPPALSGQDAPFAEPQAPLVNS